MGKFIITEEEKNRIRGLYERPKKIEPISHTELQNFTPNNDTVTSNQNILNKLKSIPEIGSLNVNDKSFLSKVSEVLTNKGITPYINVNTDQFGNPQSVNPGISFYVPKLDIEMSLEPGYFGVTKELPFLKNAKLTMSSNPTFQNNTGFKDNVNRNSSYQLGSKYGIGLSIPIGR
jgi:hypothetical protein